MLIFSPPSKNTHNTQKNILCQGGGPKNAKWGLILKHSWGSPQFHEFVCESKASGPVCPGTAPKIQPAGKPQIEQASPGQHDMRAHQGRWIGSYTGDCPNFPGK